jgi:eukaryotic-like serine/threonine-protein kinase
VSWLPDRVVDHLRIVADLPDLSATRYRLVRKVAQGGMGSVYEAHDSLLDRPVALKVLSIPDASGELSARMLREARVVARLEHPAIVPIHDVGTLEDGRVFYAMKLVQGNRLDEYKKTAQSIPDLLRVFQRVCEAVAFAHVHGVIHRDLKPENIMVGAFGEILVMDWGLAKILDPEKFNQDSDEASVKVQRATGRSPLLHGFSPDQPESSSLPAHETLHGAIMGTPLYMAPEQASGETDRIDPRTDVYALGAILQFLLKRDAGPSRSPTVGESAYRLPLFRARDRDSRIPRALAAIAAKARAEEQDQRYGSASDLAADIERFINGLAVSSFQENPIERLWRWLIKYRFMVILILTYLVARILLFFWFRP